MFRLYHWRPSNMVYMFEFTNITFIILQSDKNVKHICDSSIILIDLEHNLGYN